MDLSWKRSIKISQRYSSVDNMARDMQCQGFRPMPPSVCALLFTDSEQGDLKLISHS